MFIGFLEQVWIVVRSQPKITVDVLDVEKETMERPGTVADIEDATTSIY